MSVTQVVAHMGSGSLPSPGDEYPEATRSSMALSGFPASLSLSFLIWVVSVPAQDSWGYGKYEMSFYPGSNQALAPRDTKWRPGSVPRVTGPVCPLASCRELPLTWPSVDLAQPQNSSPSLRTEQPLELSGGGCSHTDLAGRCLGLLGGGMHP